MSDISTNVKTRLLNTICIIVGTMMFYRGLINLTQYPDNGVRIMLGLIFVGGVISIFLIFRRVAVGFWSFVVFDFLVGIVFIFVLEDIWQHHVLPHILFAAVFIPFYKDLDQKVASAFRF